MKRLLGVFVLALLVLPLSVRGQEPEKIECRIIYVPTDQAVVDKMLDMAKVTKKNVVYDLGCGDGRILITAVSRFKARRGVGVDLDPERIREARANARAEEVGDRVEFRQGDVLDVKDLSEASVVALYMGEALNRRLRPILQRTLRPGSRVVSHRFTMGDWKPQKTITVTGRDGERYDLHLWTVGEDEGKK